MFLLLQPARDPIGDGCKQNLNAALKQVVGNDQRPEQAARKTFYTCEGNHNKQRRINHLANQGRVVYTPQGEAVEIEQMMRQFPLPR